MRVLFWVKNVCNRKKTFLIPTTRHWLASESLLLSRKDIKWSWGKSLVSFCRLQIHKPGLALESDAAEVMWWPSSSTKQASVSVEWTEWAAVLDPSAAQILRKWNPTLSSWIWSWATKALQGAAGQTPGLEEIQQKHKLWTEWEHLLTSSQKLASRDQLEDHGRGKQGLMPWSRFFFF